MQRQLTIYIWLFTVWLALFGSVQPTRAVTYTSTYVSTRGYNPAAFSTTMQPAAAPEYQFRSTSVYVPATTQPAFTPLADNPAGNAPRHIRRGFGDSVSDDDDYEIGVAPKQPLGDPMILLVFAFVYFLYKRKKLLPRRE